MRRRTLLLRPMQQILQIGRGHLDAASVKRRETSRPEWRRHGHLLQQPIDRPADEFTDRAILLAGDRSKPLHHRIGKEDLNLLHGSML